MWLILSIGAAVTAALMTIIGKIGLKGVDPTLATAVRSFVMFLFMLGVVLVSGKAKSLSNLDSKAILVIVLSAVCGALSWMFYFWALKNGAASKVAAVDKLSLIFIIVLSVIFLSDTFNTKLALGSIMATVGIIFIALA